MLSALPHASGRLLAWPLEDGPVSCTSAPVFRLMSDS